MISIEGVTEHNIKIKTIVNYNPTTNVVVVNNFDIINQPIVPQDIKTEFRVDTTSGAKITVTNNPVVLESSEILKSISENVKKTYH